eukprot:sb/3470902/
MVKQIVEKWKVDDSKPVIVEKYDKVAVKNGIDDLFRKIFSSKHEITETFRTRDTRLLICFVAVVFSGVGCLYDFLHPFPESKYVLGVCSFSYFSIVGLLYIWEWFVERGTFFEGIKSGNTIRLSSYIPRFSGQYTFTSHFISSSNEFKNVKFPRVKTLHTSEEISKNKNDQDENKLGSFQSSSVPYVIVKLPAIS